ncbi:hypothetical protein PC116_g13603 [Phytophthora cactorum]|nr:hypothetical protein PC116_g13603 [Phytophthora cactorum]
MNSFKKATAMLKLYLVCFIVASVERHVCGPCTYQENQVLFSSWQQRYVVD